MQTEQMSRCHLISSETYSAMYTNLLARIPTFSVVTALEIRVFRERALDAKSPRDCRKSIRRLTKLLRNSHERLVIRTEKRMQKEVF